MSIEEIYLSPELVAVEEKTETKRQSGKRRYKWSDPLPVDEVAPQHQEIHDDLRQWGRWNFTLRKKSSLASIEALYEKYRTAKATAPGDLIDLRSIEIEKAVLKMPKMYKDTLRLYYVQGASVYTLCRIFKIRNEAAAAWMFTARCMCINLLRRNAS